MKVKIVKTKWMRPTDLARHFNTSKQNINNKITLGLIEKKKDQHGFTLVRGK